MYIVLITTESFVRDEIDRPDCISVIHYDITPVYSGTIVASSNDMNLRLKVLGKFFRRR